MTHDPDFPFFHSHSPHLYLQAHNGVVLLPYHILCLRVLHTSPYPSNPCPFELSLQLMAFCEVLSTVKPQVLLGSLKANITFIPLITTTKN